LYQKNQDVLQIYFVLGSGDFWIRFNNIHILFITH
jgi:hypothetical protein